MWTNLKDNKLVWMELWKWKANEEKTQKSDRWNADKDTVIKQIGIIQILSHVFHVQANFKTTIRIKWISKNLFGGSFLNLRFAW